MTVFKWIGRALGILALISMWLVYGWLVFVAKDWTVGGILKLILLLILGLFAVVMSIITFIIITG